MCSMKRGYVIACVMWPFCTLPSCSSITHTVRVFVVTVITCESHKPIFNVCIIVASSSMVHPFLCHLFSPPFDLIHKSEFLLY